MARQIARRCGRDTLADLLDSAVDDLRLIAAMLRDLSAELAEDVDG